MVWSWNLHQKCPFKRILTETKFSLRFLSSPSPRKWEITHPPRQSFYYKNIWRDYLLDFKILFFELSFLFIRSIGYPIQGSRVQNHRVAPRSTQPFILPRSIKLVPGNSGNLVVKSKLPPRSGSSLEAVEPHP